MNTLLKRLGWVVGIAVLLIIAIALMLPLLFDANDFKDEIAAQVEQQTGRKLTIDGDLGLSLFPWVGVKLNDVKLDNPPGYERENFARSEQIAVRVKLLPLLRRQLELDTVALYGLRLNLERNAAGQGNWEAILGPQRDQPAPEPQQSPETAPVPALSIEGIDVRDGQIFWHDRAADQQYAIKDFALETGAIAWGQPFTLASRFQLEASDPAVAAQVDLNGDVAFDPAAQIFRLKEFRVNGAMVGADPKMAADLRVRADMDFNLAEETLQAQNLEFTVSNFQAPAMGIDTGAMSLQSNVEGKGQIYQISSVRFDAELQGEALPAGALDLLLTSDMRLDLTQERLSIDELVLRTLGLQLAAKLEGEQLLTQPQLRGAVTTDPFSYRELLQRLGQAVPQTADPQVLKQGMVMIQFTASPQTLRLDPVKVKLDDSQLTGNLNVLDLQSPAIRFQLALDAIDVDRYLPASEQTSSEPPQGPASASTSTETETATLQPLGQLDVEGQIRIGRLKAANLKVSDISLPVAIKQGQLSLDPFTAKLYQGGLRGVVNVDVRAATPRFTVQNTLTGIQAAPLLKDLLAEDRLRGTARMNTQLSWRGTETAAVIESLQGTTQFTFENGAVKGINLGRLVREAKAALAGQTLPAEHRETVQTDFSVLSGSVQFADGKARNNDLQAKSPLLRVRGQGTADLLQEQVDYLLTATVVATAEGQGGEDLAALKGIPIPIRVSGPFAEPRYTLDIKALLKARAERLAAEKADVLKREAENVLQQQLEKLTKPEAKSGKDKAAPAQEPEDKVRDLLKGLF